MSWNVLIEGLVSGVLTGGASAATTVFTLFRDLRKRVRILEEKVGSAVDPRTGLYLAVSTLDETVRKLKRQIEGWEDESPTWAVRLIGRRAASNSYSLEHFAELEQRVENKLRFLGGRLDQFEETLEKSKRSLVTVENYEEDSRVRVEEISVMQKNIASTNGFLRGVMAAMGYLDSDEPKG